MESTYTKQIMKEMNEIKDTLGISAFDRLMAWFFKVSHQYNRVYESREKWKERCETAEKKLKGLRE